MCVQNSIVDKKIILSIFCSGGGGYSFLFFSEDFSLFEGGYLRGKVIKESTALKMIFFRNTYQNFL